jgi:hypothetical protein
MTAIPAILCIFPDGTSGQVPQTPIEDVPNRIAILCDGSMYTVYQTGDTIPDSVNV